MATKQIHELTAANQLAPEDQLLVSTVDGNRTRRASLGNLPYRAGGVGTVLRTLLDKLGERVSVRDFGAKGDGVADDSPAFQAALDAHEAVHVPPGRYRLNSEIQIKPRRTLVGAGRDATLIDARGPRAFTFNRNAGIHAVEAGGTPDWCRSRLGQMSIRMTTGGVRAIGHELYAEGLRFSGGQPGGWCMELEDANECSLREISAGPGGGQDDLLASGIRLYATDANRNVNFGDSLLEEISIKLKGAGTTGILIEHQGTAVNGSFFVMNNLLLNRVQVNSAGAPAGSTGVWLKRVMRSALLNVDVEFVETAFRVEGAAASGNAGSCRHVSFVNCYVLNCAVPWVDSNAALAGSVMRCSFSNCHGFGLLNPVGIASNDANARAGEGDTFMPGAVWLTEPNTGQPAVQLRAPNPGQLLVTGEFFDGTSAVRDGNPKNKKPRQGLGIDITSFNVTRLYRPRGYAAGRVLPPRGRQRRGLPARRRHRRAAAPGRARRPRLPHPAPDRAAASAQRLRGLLRDQLRAPQRLALDRSRLVRAAGQPLAAGRAGGGAGGGQGAQRRLHRLAARFRPRPPGQQLRRHHSERGLELRSWQRLHAAHAGRRPRRGPLAHPPGYR